MPKSVAAPVAGKPKKFPLRLPDDLATDLYAYCEATGAFHTKVICKAVRRFIDQELQANDGIRRDFAKEKATLVEQAVEPNANVLRLLSSADSHQGRAADKNSTNSGARRDPTPRKKDD